MRMSSRGIEKVEVQIIPISRSQVDNLWPPSRLISTAYILFHTTEARS
jgi:hypothetical protein